MNLKKFTESKNYGFYVTLTMIVLSLITAFVYIGCYVNEATYHIMNYWAFAFMLIGAVAGAALVAFKLDKIAPYVLGGCAFIGLLFFVYGFYYYASVVFVGIDLHSFTGSDIICIILFVLTTILGIVNIFLPQTKENKLEEKESEAI